MLCANLGAKQDTHTLTSIVSHQIFSHLFEISADLDPDSDSDSKSTTQTGPTQNGTQPQSNSAFHLTASAVATLTRSRFLSVGRQLILITR